MGYVMMNRVPQNERSGFTLIELLVSMAILVVIVLIVAMFFQRASVAWGVGAGRADALLSGRAMADFMAQEIEMSIPTNDFQVNPDSVEFVVLGDAKGLSRSTQFVRYKYSGGVMTRNETNMCEGLHAVSFSEERLPGDIATLPRWVDIRIAVTNSGVTNWFQSRAVFPNAGRERL